jgi:hypothetical protein
MEIAGIDKWQVADTLNLFRCFLTDKIYPPMQLISVFIG